MLVGIAALPPVVGQLFIGIDARGFERTTLGLQHGAAQRDGIVGRYACEDRFQRARQAGQVACAVGQLYVAQRFFHAASLALGALVHLMLLDAAGLWLGTTSPASTRRAVRPLAGESAGGTAREILGVVTRFRAHTPSRLTRCHRRSPKEVAGCLLSLSHCGPTPQREQRRSGRLRLRFCGCEFCGEDRAGDRAGKDYAALMALSVVVGSRSRRGGLLAR